MLITDKKELRRFYSDHRVWQGMPGIVCTPREESSFFFILEIQKKLTEITRWLLCAIEMESSTSEITANYIFLLKLLIFNLSCDII